MGLAYKDLTPAVREHMLVEIDRDLASGSLYVSNYLNSKGAEQWPLILREAAESGNDDSISARLRREGLLKHEVERRKPKGGFTIVRVPVTAPETMGEGEFCRYYVRGLCGYAIASGIPNLIVYRAKEVREPRADSQEKLGMCVVPNVILEDLRNTQGVEPALGLPPGPNSGLCLAIP